MKKNKKKKKEKERYRTRNVARATLLYHYYTLRRRPNCARPLRPSPPPPDTRAPSVHPARALLADASADGFPGHPPYNTHPHTPIIYIYIYIIVPHKTPPNPSFLSAPSPTSSPGPTTRPFRDRYCRRRVVTSTKKRTQRAFAAPECPRRRIAACLYGIRRRR